MAAALESFMLNVRSAISIAEIKSAVRAICHILSTATVMQMRTVRARRIRGNARGTVSENNVQ
jgi:hypothetical protein